MQFLQRLRFLFAARKGIFMHSFYGCEFIFSAIFVQYANKLWLHFAWVSNLVWCKTVKHFLNQHSDFQRLIFHYSLCICVALWKMNAINFDNFLFIWSEAKCMIYFYSEASSPIAYIKCFQRCSNIGEIQQDRQWMVYNVSIHTIVGFITFC